MAAALRAWGPAAARGSAWSLGYQLARGVPSALSQLVASLLWGRRRLGRCRRCLLICRFRGTP
eukprot:13568728-Alexandrium_andersonii.AAC.1